MKHRRFGPFQILDRLGVGGTGDVYLARHEVKKRLVALKVLNEQLSQDRKMLMRFKRTNEIHRRLTHPNIVRCLGFGVDHGQPYRAMEYFTGGSLCDILVTRGTLTWQQVVKVGRQTATALEYCHNLGIAHLNVKHAGLLLSKKGRLALGCLGNARNIIPPSLSMIGARTGTPTYLSPEQIQGSDEITGKADLYSLGHVLYELLVGESPLRSVNEGRLDLMQGQLRETPARVREHVPECPEELDELINSLLAVDPNDRPAGASTLYRMLGEIRDDLSES